MSDLQPFSRVQMYELSAAWLKWIWFSWNTQGYSKQSEKGSGPGVGERAPSTAEEFKRVAEEKARQGVVSQTVDKAEDAVKETVIGDSNPDNVKEKYKEPSEDITPKRPEEI